jgi:uncharacterized pyridoxamine 5'-phosphate oxidase family protein
VQLSDADVQFLTVNHGAAMITVGPDGRPKVARVAVALVDGRLWSSATRDRVRTRRLRDDPHCTLYVYDTEFAWRALETTVTLIETSDVPELSVRLFREMQGKPTGPLSWFASELDEEAFKHRMVEEGRLIYEFAVQRSYGMG